MKRKDIIINLECLDILERVYTGKINRSVCDGFDHCCPFCQYFNFNFGETLNCSNCVWVAMLDKTSPAKKAYKTGQKLPCLFWLEEQVEPSIIDNFYPIKRLDNSDLYANRVREARLKLISAQRDWLFAHNMKRK